MAHCSCGWPYGVALTSTQGFEGEKGPSTSSLWHVECHHFFPERVRLLYHQAVPAIICSSIAYAWELVTFIL